jgi:hypothetical protein
MSTEKIKSNVKRNALLITEPVWGIYNKIPIWVIEVTNDLFPVKFEYKQRGYKDLIFSEQLNKVEFV